MNVNKDKKRMMYLLKFLLILFIIVAGLLLLAFALWGHRNIPLDKLKAKYAKPPSAFIWVDGMDVHYRDEGNPGDTLPVVLLHGTSSSLQTFDAWAAILKKGKRVIRMDLPGFGLTGPFPDGDYSIAHYVTFLKHFLTDNGIRKCILGGNSLGGEIAWRFSVKNPTMVQQLILIDAAGYPIDSKSVPVAFALARVPVLNKLLTFITPRFMVKASVKNVYANKSKVTKQLVDRYFELTLRKGNRQALVDRMNMSSDKSAYQMVKKISQPSLILWGEKDLLIPVSDAYRFQNDISISTLVILKDAGHVPMEEVPEESVEAVLKFLKK